MLNKKRAVETYRQAWNVAYETWIKTVFSFAKRPNTKQWQALKLIHERCIYENQEEVTQTINATRGKPPGTVIPHGPWLAWGWQKRNIKMGADLL
jgi:hypothetical protein